MNAKQRAFLSKLASQIKPFMQIGKGGLGEKSISHIQKCMEVNELVKIKILDRDSTPPTELAEKICSQTGAELVRVIGGAIILYKAAEEPVIKLPKS